MTSDPAPASTLRYEPPFLAFSQDLIDVAKGSTADTIDFAMGQFLTKVDANSFDDDRTDEQVSGDGQRLAIGSLLRDYSGWGPRYPKSSAKDLEEIRDKLVELGVSEIGLQTSLGPTEKSDLESQAQVRIQEVVDSFRNVPGYPSPTLADELSPVAPDDTCAQAAPATSAPSASGKSSFVSTLFCGLVSKKA